MKYLASLIFLVFFSRFVFAGYHCPTPDEFAISEKLKQFGMNYYVPTNVVVGNKIYQYDQCVGFGLDSCGIAGNLANIPSHNVAYQAFDGNTLYCYYTDDNYYLTAPP